jgi:hypothetical protein
VHAYGKKLLEYAVRRLHEELAFLLGPNLELGMLDAIGDWDAEVLVQRHQPISLGRLVEKRALDRNG